MRILIIIGCLLLCGCSQFKTIESRIPVIVPRPEVKLDPEPDLPIKHLTATSAANDVVKAYVQSVALLKMDNERLRVKLEGQN